MKARIKAEANQPVIQSAGLIFVKTQWVEVPAWAEDEITTNDLLEIDEVAPKSKAPQNLTKLITPKGKRGKTV